MNETELNDWDARIEKAENENTSSEILAELANDKDEAVREAVAGNKNTSTEVLVELSKDEDWQVRETVAFNKNTPSEILIELSKDKNEFVYKAAKKEILNRKKN